MSTTSLSTVTAGDQRLATALRRLRQAERDAEEAKNTVVAAKDAIALTLREIAEPCRAGDAPLPRDLLRSLYWDEPSLRVRDLASAFGLRQSDLAVVVGPQDLTLPCLACGDDTPVRRRSRSHTPQARCHRCRLRDDIRSALERRSSEPLWYDEAGYPRYEPSWEPATQPDTRDLIDELRRLGHLDPEDEIFDDRAENLRS